MSAFQVWSDKRQIMFKGWGSHFEALPVRDGGKHAETTEETQAWDGRAFEFFNFSVCQINLLYRFTDC